MFSLRDNDINFTPCLQHKFEASVTFQKKLTERTGTKYNIYMRPRIVHRSIQSKCYKLKATTNMAQFHEKTGENKLALVCRLSFLEIPFGNGPERM